jgi:hypothetical protein
VLKPLPGKPENLRDAPRKQNDALDRVIGDTADLRIYTSADGKTRYLRVWQGDPKRDESGKSGATWFEIVEANAPAAEPASVDDAK